MFIQEADLFRGINRRIVDEIARVSVEEDYKEGDFIIREGQPAGNFLILEEGKVRLSVGTKSIINTMLSNPGEAFGWSSLVDRDTYTASAECLEPCRIIKIEKEKLLEVLEKNPASGLLFFRRLSGIIGSRLVKVHHTLLAEYTVESAPSYG